MVPAVEQTLDDRKLDLRGTEVELLLWYWATHQPQEAALWAKTKAPIGYGESSVYTALRVWAEADPEAAVSFAWPWTERLPFEKIVPMAVVRGWYARGEPQELRHWIRSLRPDITSQRAVAAYIRVVYEQEGSQAVMSWAESLPEEQDPTFKQAVFRRVVDLLSLFDTQSAMRWCEAHCDGPYGSNLRNLIGRNWARSDAPASLAWLSTAPEGYDRDLAVRMTWALWSRQDRGAAIAWMAAKTDGEPAAWVRPIYPVYARLLSEDGKPAEAVRWAAEIQSEQEREAVLIGIARAWRERDEAAAADWLLQSTLSEQAREKVRAPLEQRPQPPG
jgi:hypothetical protein